MEKNVEISILCELYGKLLTTKQYETLTDYYNNDLSLSEIGNNQNISRQAVHDIIKNGESNLYDFEEKLGLMKKTINQEKQIKQIINQMNSINKETLNSDTKKTILNIEKELNCLI